MLSEVAYGAFLQYSPRGQEEMSQRSRRWRDRIKSDRPGSIARVVDELAERAEARELRDQLFGTDVVLVPTPRRAPLRPGALWPGQRICEELLRNGFGSTMVACLERVSVVQKSAYAARGERPSARDHLLSMRVSAGLVPRHKLLLVDDFVTKGATLLAGASLLQAAFPDAEVQCFALVRTMGLVDDVTSVGAPVRGTIRLTDGGEVKRDP